MTDSIPSPEELKAITRARNLLQESIAFRTNVTRQLINEVQKRTVFGRHYKHCPDSEPRMADKRYRMRLQSGSVEHKMYRY